MRDPKESLRTAQSGQGGPFLGVKKSLRAMSTAAMD